MMNISASTVYAHVSLDLKNITALKSCEKLVGPLPDFLDICHVLYKIPLWLADAKLLKR
jgi:hypothetical protein